jgi:hypothetical protein
LDGKARGESLTRVTRGGASRGERETTVGLSSCAMIGKVERMTHDGGEGGGDGGAMGLAKQRKLAGENLVIGLTGVERRSRKTLLANPL